MPTTLYERARNQEQRYVGHATDGIRASIRVVEDNLRFRHAFETTTVNASRDSLTFRPPNVDEDLTGTQD
jgi:hypothetical protein